MAAPLALALDLGTTRVKLAALASGGTLGDVRTAEAPPPRGDELVRESDPEDYARAAEGLLARAAAPAGTALGIASQRSSFLLFERATSAPVTPLISWQDRRAAGWCQDHPAVDPRVRELTGLPLSPHYAGPKLAALLRARPALAAGLSDGTLAFGTLETWLAFRWSGGAHGTDLSMAARTQMVDVHAGEWSDELLTTFGLPRRCLPDIVDTAGREVALTNGLILAATVADQAAGLLAALAGDDRAALVNLGTGAFVLRQTGARFEPLTGYLAGPVARLAGAPCFALEGTINGGGATVDALADAPTPIPSSDPAPAAFCLPDDNGVGAPYWRAEQPFAFSDAAVDLAPPELRRVALEGLLFRVREMLADLSRTTPLERVVLSGGLARDPFVQLGLAALCDVPVLLNAQPESTLLGAAHLAAGLERAEPSSARGVARLDGLRWLRAKYPRWRRWLAALLAR